METVRLVDKCYSFRLVVTGHQGLGKTKFIEGLKLVESFEKLANGAAAPNLSKINPDPTDFVQVHPIELPIPGCFELNLHRIYMYDTPSDKPVLRNGLLERTCMEGGIDAIVLFTDGTKTAADFDPMSKIAQSATSDETSLLELQEREARFIPKFAGSGIKAVPNDASLESTKDHHSIETLVNLARKTGSALLVINLGAPLDSFSEGLLRGTAEEAGSASPVAGRFRCLACDKGDFVQASLGFIDFLEALHQMKQAEVDARKLTAERLQQQKNDAVHRKHPIPLPCRSTGPYTWLEHHIDNPTMSLNMVLYGAPDTGKSTFATALLDGFSLRDYEPTTTLEQGSFSVQLGTPHRMNLTLYDGAVQRLPLVGIALVFVDLSSPTGLEDATRACLGVHFPPTVCVVATKGDKGSLVDPAELNHMAGSLPGHLVEIDARKVQFDLVVRILQTIADADKKLRATVARSQQLRQDPNRRAPGQDSSMESSQIPTTEAGLRYLFHRYDLDGNGYIDMSEAEEIYKEYNHAEFGDCRKEMRKILERNTVTTDQHRITFDQFTILMCSLAKM